MNIKGCSAISAALLLLLGMQLAEAKPKKSAYEKSLERQRVADMNRAMAASMMGTPGAAAWTDVSMAPANFPAPIFRGNQTQFLKVNAAAVPAASGQQLTLQTRDPSNMVFFWYKKYMPGSGYKLDEKTPAQAPGGRAYMLKGDSDKYRLVVSIIAQDDARGPASQIQLLVSQKAAKKS